MPKIDCGYRFFVRSNNGPWKMYPSKRSSQCTPDAANVLHRMALKGDADFIQHVFEVTRIFKPHEAAII